MARRNSTERGVYLVGRNFPSRENARLNKGRAVEQSLKEREDKWRLVAEGDTTVLWGKGLP